MRGVFTGASLESGRQSASFHTGPERGFKVQDGKGILPVSRCSSSVVCPPLTKEEGRGKILKVANMADEHKMFVHLLFILHWCIADAISGSRQSVEPRQLFVYTCYKDVQMFHYLVPSEVSVATWSFVANENGDCNPRQVALHLQHGGYPVINPDNSSFPDGCYTERTSSHRLSISSDRQAHRLNVTSPTPGDWFLVAYLAEKNDRIEQKGLYKICTTMLSSSITFVYQRNIIYLLPGVALPQRIENPQHYKFFAPFDTWTARVTLGKCSGDCAVVLTVSPRVLPSVADPSVNCTLTQSKGPCTIEFIPHENAWHFILLEVDEGTTIEFHITVETSVCENGNSPTRYMVLSELKFANVSGAGGTPTGLKVPSAAKRILVPLHVTPKVKTEEDNCWPRVDLVRNTYPNNFVFSYTWPDGHAANPRSSAPSPSPATVSEDHLSSSTRMDISTLMPTLLAFLIQPVVDIGGTMAIELALDPNVNVTAHNVSVMACVQLGSRGIVNEDGKQTCSSQLSVQVNSSSEETTVGHVLIPFPEPGNWYVTLHVLCYVVESRNGTEDRSAVPCDGNATAIALAIVSGSCIYGGCGPFGRCYQYISGGFIFSTCVCNAGWKGWGCSDESSAIPDHHLLLSTLLLTLSNLLFFPAVLLAVYRRYYTEAFVYFFTMFFSTFYHACDEEAYAFCLMRLSVMQFCDFFSAILSFWVTLVAMADVHPKLRSILHMAGAMGVAMGVEYDRTGLWVFVVPAITSLVVLIASWAWHCRRRKVCYPEKRVWLVCLLPGLLLATVGIVCYAFLETKDNYKYVHSSWHAAMAISILFLLPKPAIRVRARAAGRRLELGNSVSYIRAEEPNFKCNTTDQLLVLTPSDS